MATNRRALNFGAIRDRVSPKDALRYLGWRPVSVSGQQLRGPCPFHRSRNLRSRSLSVGRRMMYCHKCRRFADALALWAHCKGMNLLEAAYDLCAAFGIPPPFLT